jgi:preprotein translocase subunit SecE
MGFLATVQQFFREVMAEFRKVNWPSRKEVSNSTVIILVVVIVIASFLWGVDIGLARVVELILR